MKKITIEMTRAFENNENKTKDNTQVKTEVIKKDNTQVKTEVIKKDNTQVKITKLYLWGNCIAKKEDNKLYINMCGYNTNTTRERLNGLSGVFLKSKDFTPYLNGIEISSCGWYEVK